ncbi:MAG: ABC transporter permease [Deltaproteobacteria bacterium]|nr:ABC transporter permease [Deltaproteobacteria bacterium]
MIRYLRRMRAIAYKELIHMARDMRVVYMALGLPVVMLVLFGYAVSMDIDHVSLAVVDQDATRASRRLIEAFVAGGSFVHKINLRSVEQAQPLLRAGKVKAVLVIPKKYQRDRARGLDVGSQLLLDGSDGAVASIVMGNAMRIVHSLPFAERVNLKASLSQGPPIRSRFNPAMLSAYNIVPGVIVMILGMVSTVLTALTVAREWERGNMEQLFATPVRRGQIILGKLIPYAVLGFVQTLLVLTLGSYMFDVPIVGSLMLLFGASLLFLIASLAVGLFVSVATKSQILSILFAALLGILPALILSGFIFPIANMPEWLQVLTMFFPARYYLLVLRGVLLKGNGLQILAPQLLALTGFAVAVLALAVAKFRRRLD